MIIKLNGKIIQPKKAVFRWPDWHTYVDFSPRPQFTIRGNVMNVDDEIRTRETGFEGPRIARPLDIDIDFDFEIRP